MPLVLGKRADVEPKKRIVSDRSTLSTLDWCAIAVDLSFRHAHYAMEDAGERARKLAKLDTLLDDPDLAGTHGPNDPDRLDAIMRHAALHFERKRFTAEARRAAKETALLWERVPNDDWQTWLRDGYAIGWGDSGVWPLALSDVTLSRLRFWIEGGETWRNRETVEMPPCPY